MLCTLFAFFRKRTRNSFVGSLLCKDGRTSCIDGNLVVMTSDSSPEAPSSILGGLKVYTRNVKMDQD